MKHLHGCSPCKGKRTAFQPTAYQTVPFVSAKAHCGQETATANLAIPIAAFKLGADWKNVSVHPGGIIDFREHLSSADGVAVRTGQGEYTLSAAGVYIAVLQLHLLHPGQIVFCMDGEEQTDSALGVSQESTLLHGHWLFHAQNSGSVLSVRNPLQSCRPLMIASCAGGILPVASDLFIARLA